MASVDLDATAKTLSIGIDFTPGRRFAVTGEAGVHPAHDTMSKRYRHLNFFQHECYLQVRLPRVMLPSGAVRHVEPDWAGKLSGFTLLFEAFVLMLTCEVPFEAMSRLSGEIWHRVASICQRHVDLALRDADFSSVSQLVAIDETSRSRGHHYVTLAADLLAHGADLEAINSVSIGMSPAFIKNCTAHLPKGRISFDKHHVLADASQALDATRRL